MKKIVIVLICISVLFPSIVCAKFTNNDKIPFIELSKIKKPKKVKIKRKEKVLITQTDSIREIKK